MNKLILILLVLVSFEISTANATKRTVNSGNLVLQDIPEIPKSIADDLNQYQNIRSAPFREWSKDGKSIFISTRFGDVSQIHQVDMPLGARKQITFSKEPVGGVQRRPRSEFLSFTMDAGGSEFAQIFLLDPKTGKQRMLTDGKSRNGSLEWSPNGKYLAYQSTKRNGKSNDIWVMEPENPLEARIILESNNGAWWGPASWTSDSKKVLALEYISASDSRIYLIDVETGSKTLLEGGADNPSVNYPQAFNASNDGFYFVTNQFSEFEQLAYRKFDQKKAKVITSKLNWDVESLSFNNDKSRAVFSVNENGLDVIYLMDPKTHKYKKVKNLPVGLVGGLKFSPNGDQLAITLNTAQSPSDSFVLDLKRNRLSHGKIVRWTQSEVGGLNTAKFTTPELIHFKSFDKRKIP
ncbi:MAG: TolB family protein, partial [Kangiellaceae bacterium]